MTGVCVCVRECRLKKKTPQRWWGKIFKIDVWALGPGRGLGGGAFKEWKDLNMKIKIHYSFSSLFFIRSFIPHPGGSTPIPGDPPPGGATPIQGDPPLLLLCSLSRLPPSPDPDPSRS